MNAGVKGAGMKQTFDIYGAYEERSNPYEGQRMAIGATSATAHAHKDLWGGYALTPAPAVAYPCL